MSIVPTLSAGDIIGRFEITGALQRGGMGAVYAARDPLGGELVALKVMHSGASAGRFEREGRISDRLSHPHIVAGRGRGVSDGVAWIAMELLQGRDLQSLLTRGPLPYDLACTAAAQVCSALVYAHAQGVVHRDLKPSNIFLCDGPEALVKVLDFGVALVEGDRDLTRSGAPVGTPAYMSPEQARGSRDIDGRSDLWSLGVVLYECLSGRVPFAGGSVVGTLYQIVSEDPIDLARLRPDLPSPVAELVRRAMSKPRDRRPPTAAAFLAAMAALPPLASVPSAGAPTELPTGTLASTAELAAAPDEVRLISAVCLRGVSDRIFAEGVARALDGRVEALASGAMLVLFGVDHWSGDEPTRAVRCARAVAASCRAVGVATGRALRSAARVTGEAIDVAAGLAEQDGLWLDASTAELTGSEAHGGRARDDLAGAPSTSAAQHSGVFATPFVGRVPELAALERCAQQAADEFRTRAAVVLGAPGMGKSRLRHRAAVRVADTLPGTRFLTLGCESALRDSPFAALRDAIARNVEPGVAQMFTPALSATGDPMAALDRARASLKTLLEGLAADGAVVVAIDDAQWLDLSSRATLRWIREQALDLPLAFWVFGRPEAAAAASDLAGSVLPIELGPLAPIESAQLLSAIAGTAPVALLDRAGGQPLFLEALGRLHREQGPDAASAGRLPVSIEGAHLSLLDQIAPAERDFLKRASVFGRTFWVGGVAAAGGDTAALPRLRDEGLVAPRPRSRLAGQRELSFRTGVSRDVAYGMLPDAQRALLHGRAAGWLAERAGVAPDELARHWDLAGKRAHAAEAYVAATESAAAVADTAAACAHAAHALSLTDEPALRWRALVARDNALQVAGDAALQREGMDALTALAAGLDVERQAEAAWRRCYFERLSGEAEAALAAGQRAVELADASGAARWRILARIERALLLTDGGTPVEARTLAAEARAMAERAGDGWLTARADATMAYSLSTEGDPLEALGLFERAGEGFARAGDRRREALMHNNAAAITLQLGRLAEAAGLFEAARAASRRIGNAVTAAVATHNLGVILRMEGDLSGAMAVQDEADAAASALGFTRLASFVANERARIALITGDLDALDGFVGEALRRAVAGRATALSAAARALALRAAARRGAVTAEALDEARALAEGATGEARCELWAAVWEAGGREAGDGATLREAVGRVTAAVGVPEEREALGRTLLQRLAVPSAGIGLLGAD